MSYDRASVKKANSYQLAIFLAVNTTMATTLSSYAVNNQTQWNADASHSVWFMEAGNYRLATVGGDTALGYAYNTPTRSESPGWYWNGFNVVFHVTLRYEAGTSSIHFNQSNNMGEDWDWMNYGSYLPFTGSLGNAVMVGLSNTSTNADQITIANLTINGSPAMIGSFGATTMQRFAGFAITSDEPVFSVAYDVMLEFEKGICPSQLLLKQYVVSMDTVDLKSVPEPATPYMFGCAIFLLALRRKV